MNNLKLGYTILAVDEDGVKPAMYCSTVNKDGLPIFDTETLAQTEIPKIAEKYYERGNVPMFVVTQCTIPS